MPDEGPLTLAEILSQEYKELRPESAFDSSSTADLYQAIQTEPKPLSALCISGGGIRSATFALGALQGLAERGLLGEFDYLSTVSGGGYIGSWLTSWKQREKGIDQVIPRLKRNAPLPGAGEPDPIQHLREYNNYLSPKLGLLSTDTWTLAATVGRNMFLNWLVFVPLLLFALALPRLVLALARLGETFFDFYGDPSAIRVDLLGDVIPVISGALFALAIFNLMRYLPGVGGKDHTEMDYLRYCLAPLICSAVAFLVEDSWFTSDGAHTKVSYANIVLAVIGSAMAGWLAYLLFSGKDWKERWRLFLPVSGAVILTGWAGASAAWLLSARVYPVASWPVFVTVAAPLELVALLFAGTLFVGLTSSALLDDDREWMSRAGAWILLFILCWTGICALVLIAPSLAMLLPGWWAKVAAAAAGLGGGWITALAGSNERTKAAQGSHASSCDPPPSMLMTIAMKLAAPVFVIVFLTALSLLTDWLLAITGLGGVSRFDPAGNETFIQACPGCNWGNHAALLEGTRSESVLLLAVAFLAFGWLMARFININVFSLHAMYRNRIIRAYLGASNSKRKANRFTGFAEDDNTRMADLDPGARPFHVINVTLNLVAGQRLAWQQRKAESFTISRLHCGSFNLGYRPSSEYGGRISLGTAVTISGAAASPNMGYHSSPIIGFIMTLFNARLGAWLGNPGAAGEKTWKQAGPQSAVTFILREAFGLTNANSSYVYLSDGGHFENLGLYEMVMRRCRFIVVLDGGCDPDFTYDDLGNALRKIRIDMKVPIEFDAGFSGPLRKKKQRFAMARILYSVADCTPPANDGYLLYLKPMMRRNENPDVAAYFAQNPTFPHQSTSDQFFDESQTESYRMLGLQTVDEICEGWDGKGGMEGFFRHRLVGRPILAAAASPGGAS